MAYLEIGMWEVLEVLRRVHRGESQAAIRRVTGRTRKTVRRYTALARKLGWDPAGPEPDEELAHAVARRLRPFPAEVSPGPVRPSSRRTASRSVSGLFPRTSAGG